MKLDELRKIIREEVRAAVKAEVQDMLTEAVKVASAPTKMQSAPQAGNTSWSAPKPKPATVFGDPIMEMLNQTKASMSQQDYQQVVSMDSSMVTKPNFAQSMASQMGMSEPTGPMPGLDLSQLGFLNKAKAVLDAANKKDRERKGL